MKQWIDRYAAYALALGAVIALFAAIQFKIFKPFEDAPVKDLWFDILKPRMEKIRNERKATGEAIKGPINDR